MTIKNIAHSRKAKLLLLSEKDNKKYQQMLVRYFNERFLARLSKSSYRSSFILKGGSLLFAYEEFTPRPTLDIDFMGNRINNDAQIIKNAFVEIINTSVPEDGVQFHPETIKSEPITVEKKYPGTRITFDVSLDSIRKTLTMDVGFGDVITPHPVEMDYPVMLEESEEINLVAYSLETVVAEKFQTMIDRSVTNSRMKDFFDLYRILSVHQFDTEILQEAINATFANRNTVYSPDHSLFGEDFKQDRGMTTQWNNYLKKMKLPQDKSFAEIVDFITEKLRPYWEKLPTAGK